MLYQAPEFDVLGSLDIQMKKGCTFLNFDSTVNGTFAAIESLLFSTPISPVTVGKYGLHGIPWSIPNAFKKQGYKTIFLTSARSGWHQLDKIMKRQGFDEIIDSGVLTNRYPEAESGIWGVWDEYAFKWLKDWLEHNSGEEPYFIFVLTSTNHPPYDSPTDLRPPLRDPARWLGERQHPQLEKNLDTYFYAADLLGKFVEWHQKIPFAKNTVVAATGDHNGRTFGNYTSPDRLHLLNQVPFMVWDSQHDCGNQLAQPASHRDVFPTLFSMLSFDYKFPGFGRNLMAPLNSGGQVIGVGDKPRSLNYLGYGRSANGSWRLGEPASFVCKSSTHSDSSDCKFDPKEDAVERANQAILDWSIRKSLSRN